MSASQRMHHRMICAYRTRHMAEGGTCNVPEGSVQQHPDHTTSAPACCNSTAAALCSSCHTLQVLQHAYGIGEDSRITRFLQPPPTHTVPCSLQHNVMLCLLDCSSLAFAGTVLVRSPEEVQFVEQQGPATLLAEAGQPWETATSLL